MSSFKDFRIKVAWLASRYYGLTVLFIFSALGCGIVGFAYFWGLDLISIKENAALSSNPVAAMVCLVGGFGLFFSLLFIIRNYEQASNNWRIAIDKAQKFARENNIEDKVYLAKRIIKTKRTKDPTIVNKWVEFYEEWQAIKKVLEQLEREREILPERIATNEKRLKLLEEELFS
jgi:hypothetical protein